MPRHGNAPGLAPAGREEHVEAEGIVARALSPTESLRLSKLESTISTGIQTFVEVGNALREIRDSKLYRENWTTFEDYTRDRWGWSRQHANRVIGAAGVALELEPMGSTLPERALRPLVNLPSEERKTVFSKAKVLAGDKPVTSTHVEAAVESERPKAKLPMGPPRDGLDFARIAIMNLEQIRPDDAERARAFAFVRDAVGKLTPDMVPPTDAAADPRDRVLSAVTAALWIYQNDETAGRRGKPGPADRKRIRYEVEGILREFTKGTLKPRMGPRAESETAVPQDAPGATQRDADDVQHGDPINSCGDSLPADQAVGA